MPNYRYRAMNDSGELVSGAMAGQSAGEVAQRIETLGLVLVENLAVEEAAPQRGSFFSFFGQPRAEDVTVFTRDLGLLLRAGARVNDGLELLATDSDIGRLRPVVAEVRSHVLDGETFADALSHYPKLFNPMYVALVRVGEASGSLDQVLEVLGGERMRAEAVRRKISEAIRYPAFIFVAAACVLTFFLTFVLPQFASVLADLGAKIDPTLAAFLALSSFLRAHIDAIALGLVLVLTTGWLLLRRPSVRASALAMFTRLPLVRRIMPYYRAPLFCRNLGVLLGSGVHLTTTLRILVDIMATTGPADIWKEMVDRVRHGAKLSDALSEVDVLPAMAVRMLRLGDETGQLPVLAGRVAEFYEAKLQRALDRLVGIAGPAAIIVISIVVGGLIVSVMTALISVSQLVG
jgi:general secretion pathway protein F